MDPNSSTGLDGGLGDSDHDGLNNFGEYAFGLNPSANDSSQAVKTSTLTNPADGKRYLTLSYRRRLDASSSGLTYHVQTSTDLVNWISDGVDVEVVNTTPDLDGVVQLTVVRIKPSLDEAGAKKFARITVLKQ